MDEPVAAIIATMNRPNYARDAIRSVCEQTYDPLELVIVDGSIDDETETVVEEFRESSPRTPITYIRNHTPQGLPAARNQAVAATDVEYLAFLDDDDQWRPEKITRQMEVFDSRPDTLGLVHTSFVGWNDDGSHLFTFVPDYEDAVYPELLVRNLVATPSSVMVRREPFETIGGFDEELRFCEDWDFYLRLARNYDFEYLSKPLVDRRYHDEAMTEDAELFLKYRAELLQKHADTLEAYGVADRAWYQHYSIAASKHLEAGNHDEAKYAYRAALVIKREIRLVAGYLLLSMLPDGYVLPTVQALSGLEKQARSTFQTVTDATQP